MVLLIQKEVAERILARDGKESILSIAVKAYGTARIEAKVPAGAFNPPPKVDSAILAVTNISRNNLKNISEENFFKVVKAGFAQKRKTLAGNLKRALGDTLGVPDKIRAEDVPLKSWLEIAKKV